MKGPRGAARSARFQVVMWAGAALLLVALVLGAVVGAVDLGWGAVLRALAVWLPGVEADPVDVAIVWNLRAPRALLAALVGASLALAGALMQGLFRNSLASPGLIGTSAGASFGAVLALSLGWSMTSTLYLPLCAVAGAFAALLVVTRIASRGGELPTATLLLTGVAVTAFIGALNAFVIARSYEDWDVARRIAYWLMGGVMERSWLHVGLILPCFAVGAVVALVYARDLDLLLEGEEMAQALGVEVEATKRVVLLTAALLTGSAVAVSGIIGFVGLVIPHLARILVGPGHRRLLPACLITGAWFLVLADLIARLAARPTEVHLGVVTAFLGAPFFLFLLRRQRHAELL